MKSGKSKSEKYLVLLILKGVMLFKHQNVTLNITFLSYNYK